MRPRDHLLARDIEDSLLTYEQQTRPLPGILNPANRESLLEQILESVHRVSYVERISSRDISERRAEPNDDLFDPLKAAILQQRHGNVEEAYWLVFLFVHFGRHPRARWHYVREIYGRLGGPGRWDWQSTSEDPAGFREWLRAHENELKRAGVPRGFGNHRKYESLAKTGAVVESYVRWVAPPRTHEELMVSALQNAGDPRRAFDDLYRGMTVERFGRTARFDYLTMIGKLGLCGIRPGSTYMTGATGPLEGARLLFGINGSPAALDGYLAALDEKLNVGMQVIEDALCNWQKSPDVFRPFRG